MLTTEKVAELSKAVFSDIGYEGYIEYILKYGEDILEVQNEFIEYEDIFVDSFLIFKLWCKLSYDNSIIEGSEFSLRYCFLDRHLIKLELVKLLEKLSLGEKIYIY